MASQLSLSFKIKLSCPLININDRSFGFSNTLTSLSPLFKATPPSPLNLTNVNVNKKTHLVKASQGIPVPFSGPPHPLMLKTVVYSPLFTKDVLELLGNGRKMVLLIRFVEPVFASRFHTKVLPNVKEIVILSRAFTTSVEGSSTELFEGLVCGFYFLFSWMSRFAINEAYFDKPMFYEKFGSDFDQAWVKKQGSICSLVRDTVFLLDVEGVVQLKDEKVDP